MPFIQIVELPILEQRFEKLELASSELWSVNLEKHIPYHVSVV